MNERVHRESLRKQLIRQAMAPGIPMLLDELRWKVLQAEAQLRGKDLQRIDRSQMVSFARAVREHCPDFTIWKEPISSSTPVGLVARCAVYRLQTVARLAEFLAGPSPAILCRFHGQLPMEEPRYLQHRYVIPQRHAWTFRFFPAAPVHRSYDAVAAAPGTLIPATKSQQMTIVAPRGVRVSTGTLAEVPWKLFGHEAIDDWFALQASECVSVLVGRARRWSYAGW